MLVRLLILNLEFFPSEFFVIVHLYSQHHEATFVEVIQKWLNVFLLFRDPDLKTSLAFSIKGINHESLDVRVHALSKLGKILQERRV